jgi:hypothetical protein
MPSALGGQHFFAERVGVISLIPFGGYQQKNTVASFHSAYHFLIHAYTSDARNAFPVVGVVTDHLILY